MKLLRVAIISLFVLVFAGSLTVSAVEPEWYYVDFHQECWFADNKTDIRYNHTDRYIGQIQFGPDQYFYDNNGAGWNGNFSLVVSTPFDGFYLQNVEDSAKTFPAHLDINRNGNLQHQVQTSFSTFNYPVAWNTGRPLFSFSITIFPRFDDEQGFKGTYFLPLTIALYVDYGTEDELLIEESLFNILVYFVESSSSGGPGSPGGGQGGGNIFTNLWIQRYPSADGVDIPSLQLSQGSLAVGAVNFSSNDKRNPSKYLIKLSPGENPEGMFAFHKQGSTSSSPIPYKVYIPTRTSLGSQSTAFSVPVETRSPAGYWQDYFEVGITQMNHLGWTFTAGDYTSLIQIELIRE